MRLAGLFAATVLALQLPSQTPVFKGRIDLARVEVTVVDNKTGKPISDLTRRDFTVVENGKSQTITAFSSELLAPESSSPSTSGAVVRGTEGLAPRNRRIFVFILHLGRFSTDGPVKPLDGTIRFIREQLLPQDLVSVMAFNRATDLTTNHEQVAQVVERLKLRNESISFKMRLYFADKMFLNKDIPPEIQSEIDAIFQAPGLDGPGVRSVPNMLMGTDAFRKLDDARATSRDLAQPVYADLRRPWNKWVWASDLMKIYGAIEYVRQLDGQKHVVCLTTSLQMNVRIQNLPPSLHLHSKDDEALLIVRANDARVALDIIHTAGTAQAGAMESDGIMSSENLSASTGGQFTSVRTADDALARVDDVTRTGYVLGYTPSNPNLDGKYRNVSVKVNRKDVTVIFRHGYSARSEIAPLDMPSLVTNARLRDAATTDLDEHDIKIEAKASVVPGPGQAGQVRVDLKIDASRLTLTPAGAKREGKITLWILCGDAKQDVVGTLKQDMTLSLDDVLYQRAMTGGIPYTATVPITGAATSVKVLVYDYAADLIGTAVIRLK